jgi:hypothetical protein
VVAAGSAPLNYQWSKDGAVVTGATADVYRIQPVQAADAGTYTVSVSNMVNSVTSTGAVVQIGQAPAITAQPESLAVNPGTLAVFSVTATGTGPLTYKWMKGTTVVSTSTLSSSYSIASAQSTHAGTYSVEVSNTLGKVTSGTATLALNVAPAITKQPVGASIAFGGSHVFSVTATGTGPLSYQWYRGGLLLSGGTSSTYTISSARSEDSGDYTVKVTNMVTTVTSTPAAKLTVTGGPPAIAADPASIAVVFGVNSSLTAKVRSTLNFSYQWSKDGAPISSGSLYSLASGSLTGTTGETTLTLGLLNPSALTVGTYKVTVTNEKGTVSSAEATVTAFAKPKFEQATLVKANKTYSLTTFADGAGPIWTGVVPSNDKLVLKVTPDGSSKYEWTYTTIQASSVFVTFAGQTTTSFDFSVAGLNKGPGYYICKATNGPAVSIIKFAITSFAAALSPTEVAANGPPLEIVSEPVSVSASVGGAVVLGVGVTAGERTYAWFKESTPGKSVPVSVGGSGLLYLNPVQASDAGAYFVVVTDALGNTVTSRPATVTVLPAND